MTKEEALLKIEELKNFIENNDNKKEIELSIKDFILESINNCVIKFNNKYLDSIFYFKNDTFMLEYNRKTEIFYISYPKIWSLLESKYSLNYYQIKGLTKGILEQYFNCKVDTTFPAVNLKASNLEEHFKCKVETTNVF